MSFDTLKEISQKLAANPTLSDWGELFAMLTWQKIGFCRHAAKLNLHEVTITQDLLFSFWQLAMHSPLPVQMYQSTNEKTNGNDLEIAVQTDSGFILFPSQAKMLAVSNRYLSINRHKKGAYQIDRLLAYSKQIKGFPLYLFYNFCTDANAIHALEDKYETSIDKLGCSICPAMILKHHFFDSDLKKWRIPSFYSVHNLFYSPLSLFLRGAGQRFEQLQSLFEITPGTVRFYTQAELTDKKLWKDLAPLPSIGRISPVRETVQFFNPSEETTGPFRPRFRILLSTQRKKGATIRIS
jgi:hypothetical protein